MVPLERTERRSSTVEPVFVPRKPARADHSEAPAVQEPRRFKVLDVMTRQSLVDDAGAQETVDALKAVRSAVDIDVYVWQSERERWRRLTFAEKRAMLDLARS